jgi:threonine synthase
VDPAAERGRSALTTLRCARCGRDHDPEILQGRCACGGTLAALYDVATELASVRRRPPGMWRYRELLPLRGDPVSLGETETPLLRLDRLSQPWGVETWLKDESLLPGTTFKARGAAIGLSRAIELGAERLVMPSAGNAGGAWALYAARAGVPLTVTMSRHAPASNQREVRLAGAELELVDGTIADAGRRAVEIAHETGAFLSVTFGEPYRVEGKKTAWLETFDAFGDGSTMRAPRTIVLPVGGGVAAVAALKAYEEARAAGWLAGDAPRLVGVQAQLCAPIVRAFERGEAEVEAWSGNSETIAAGLRVPAPSEGSLVLEKIRASGGTMASVSEEEIVGAVRRLASTEGIFACPEGAATVVAAERLAEAGALEGPVVLYNTGAGAKYLDMLSQSLG